MTFTVKGVGTQGVTLIACETVVGALEKADELVRDGFADVLIANHRGAEFTLDQFERFFCM